MTYIKPGFEIQAGHGGAIAMMLMGDDEAADIVQWGKEHINDDEVYGKDGKGRDGSPHVTLQNGIMCEDADELERLFSALSSMEAELGPIGVFRQDGKDYDVVHIEVICEDLHKANAMVDDLLEVNNPHPDYHPHITLGYVNKGAGKRFEGLEDFVGKKVNLKKMVVDGQNIEPRMLDLKEHEHVDQLPGGKADDMSESDFDLKSLEKGANHELEHTKNIEIAREIAMDHLAEDPKYYDKLEKVEKVARLGEPLKESLDYGGQAADDDIEEYLLDSGRSAKSLSRAERKRILSIFEKDFNR
jgi:2'-5' RNA ligase